jgi:hypothetical protein
VSLRVEVRLLSTEDGGRSAPIVAGYRPQPDVAFYEGHRRVAVGTVIEVVRAG